MPRDEDANSNGAGSAERRKALQRAASKSEAVRKAEGRVEKLRGERNKAIIAAAEAGAPATEIAQRTGIKQSYISRVIRSGGRPPSGSDLDRQRTGEPAGA